MTRTREPAVAGAFYPSDPQELRAAVERLLDRAAVRTGPPPRALVVPHAGYLYSGPVAASAYARLRPHAARYRRVVLLGPAHRWPLRGLALPDADAFETPLGPVPIDRAALARLDNPAVAVSAEAHRFEHSLEVQLPFLQVVLARFALLPLLVGSDAGAAAAAVLDGFLDAPDTLVVVSSDLSHYLAFDEARRRDAASCRAIEALDATALGPDDACGAAPLRGLLLAAARHGLAAETLDLRNSGDTSGDRYRVVGYGAWSFTETEQCRPAA
jgi:AmmeMemoRadiSam system protein B